MPVAKSRTKQVNLVQQVADMLEIPAERIYLTGENRLQLRVWTGGLDDSERERLASLKEAVKHLAGKTGTKIAMSDMHPEEQAAFELRRRHGRGKAFLLRKKGIPSDPTDDSGVRVRGKDGVLR